METKVKWAPGILSQNRKRLNSMRKTRLSLNRRTVDPNWNTTGWRAHLRKHLMSNQFMNESIIDKLLYFIASVDMTFSAFVGCCVDGVLKDLIIEAGINYFSDNGGDITNALRDYVDNNYENYELLKMRLYEVKDSEVDGKDENVLDLASLENEMLDIVSDIDNIEIVDPDLMEKEHGDLSDIDLSIDEEIDNLNEEFDHTIEYPGIHSNIEDYFQISDTILGKGEFGTVKQGTDKNTGEEVAIKVISKSQLQDIPVLQNEIDILRRCKHPHIVELKSVFETHSNLYIVMELVKGGELYDEIIERNYFTEQDAANIMRQVLEALAYIHSNGIIHRDLKLENLLLSNKKASGNDLIVKLADFGLSRIYRGQIVRTACGTPFYVAPEVLLGTGYGTEVDMWSAGVMLYILFFQLFSLR
eukprot:TRINITY_DN3936_c0_g1_i1.p1 TRINITY_DN3936_c0_g1~~TRINITY_DN3936_c0_g1_i1.p1  ORF type:complete len:416 (+),score=106.38 TRINITY_DN3936_c0_g1_i1:1-1248(+)